MRVYWRKKGRRESKVKKGYLFGLSSGIVKVWVMQENLG